MSYVNFSLPSSNQNSSTVASGPCLRIATSPSPQLLEEIARKANMGGYLQLLSLEKKKEVGNMMAEAQKQIAMTYKWVRWRLSGDKKERRQKRLRKERSRIRKANINEMLKKGTEVIVVDDEEEEKTTTIVDKEIEATKIAQDDDEVQESKDSKDKQVREYYDSTESETDLDMDP